MCDLKVKLLLLYSLKMDTLPDNWLWLKFIFDRVYADRNKIFDTFRIKPNLTPQLFIRRCSVRLSSETGRLEIKPTAQISERAYNIINARSGMRELYSLVSGSDVSGMVAVVFDEESKNNICSILYIPQDDSDCGKLVYCRDPDNKIPYTRFNVDVHECEKCGSYENLSKCNECENVLYCSERCKQADKQSHTAYCRKFRIIRSFDFEADPDYDVDFSSV
jgi:hypothetical protein